MVSVGDKEEYLGGHWVGTEKDTGGSLGDKKERLEGTLHEELRDKEERWGDLG